MSKPKQKKSINKQRHIDGCVEERWKTYGRHQGRVDSNREVQKRKAGRSVRIDTDRVSQHLDHQQSWFRSVLIDKNKGAVSHHRPLCNATCVRVCSSSTIFFTKTNCSKMLLPPRLRLAYDRATKVNKRQRRLLACLSCLCLGTIPIIVVRSYDLSFSHLRTCTQCPACLQTFYTGCLNPMKHKIRRHKDCCGQGAGPLCHRHIRECPGAGMYFTSPVVTVPELKDVYSDQYHDQAQLNESSLRVQGQFAFIEQYVIKKREVSVPFVRDNNGDRLC